ncbi:MAG: BREX protein BrxB domain-containing protein, partial [Limisphaerales bacterium]
KQWLLGEKMLLAQADRSPAGIDFREINKTLAKALTEGPELLELLKASMQEAAAKAGGLLLLTDLEALHPYLRINSIEARLQGEIRCPVIVLYPGKREGKTSLRFLEFYPADPNYRSEHIG